MQIDELESEALKLTPERRARLAKRLIDSLDDLSADERQELWMDEAERRQKEIDAGHVELLRGEDVLRRVRSELG